MRPTSWQLDTIQVASPCHVAWDSMQGSDLVRHCGQCQRHVYQLSALTRPEAEALVQQHEGRLCVRFFRRTDGTVLTADCPIGLRSVRRRLARAVAGMAALIVFMTSGALFARHRGSVPIEETPLLYFDDPFAPPPEQVAPPTGPLARFAEWLDPPLETGSAVMGEVCLPGE